MSADGRPLLPGGPPPQRTVLAGALAAGVVHQVNNQAAALMANADYLSLLSTRLREIAAGSAGPARVEKVAAELESCARDSGEAVRRIARLTTAFEALAGGGGGAAPYPLAELARTACELAMVALQRKVEYRLDLDQDHEAPAEHPLAALALVALMLEAAGEGKPDLLLRVRREPGGLRISAQVAGAKGRPGIAAPLLAALGLSTRREELPGGWRAEVLLPARPRRIEAV